MDDEFNGWPGDGSGTDDLADYNANEASDYSNEGQEDSCLESEYEDRNGCGIEDWIKTRRLKQVGCEPVVSKTPPDLI